MTRPSIERVVHTDHAEGWERFGSPENDPRSSWSRESYRYEFNVSRSSGLWLDVHGSPWRTPSDYVAYSSEFRLGNRVGSLVRPGYWPLFYSGVTPAGGQLVRTPFDVGQGFPGADDSILNRLELKVMNKLAAVDVNIGAELGESRETLRMLASTAKSVAAAFRAIKRGDAGGLAKALGASDKKGLLPNMADQIGKRRLEFEYGWKPLIQTTANLVDRFGKGLKRAHVFSARCIHSESYPVSMDLAEPYWVSKVSGSSKRLHIVKIFASPKSETLDALGQFGLTNPAGIIWELVPYSFVADWFIPVGDMLEAASLSMSADCLGGYRACFQEQSISTVERIDEASGEGSFHGSLANSTYRSRGYQRKAYGTSFPWPKLITKSPFGDDHILNAGALLHQWIRRK